MPRHGRPQRLARSCTVLFAIVALGLGGCRHRTPRSGLDPVAPPPIEAAPTPVEAEPTRPAPVPTPPPPAEPAVEAAPLRVAILLSDDLPRYEAVGAALAAYSDPDHTARFDLDGNPRRARDAAAAVEEAGYDNVVAVGLLAARVAQGLPAAKVVFCQVLNYQEHGLEGPRLRGVSPLPGLDEAVAAWVGREGNPGTVGVITGPGHEASVDLARASFARHDIELLHRVSGSDKETSLLFRRMADTIGGYWLLPDNRVLSRGALREMLALARGAGIGVLVDDPRFLEQGATLSASCDPDEVARVALATLEAARDAEGFDDAGLVPLQQCRVEFAPPTQAGR